MTTLYRQHQQDLLPGPFGADGGAGVAAAEGAAKDALLARLKASVYAGLVADPDGRGREAPADGLPRLGLDADIECVPGESDTAYRARIAAAWESWSWAGTEYGVMHAVGLLGYGTPQVFTVRRAAPAGWPSTKWAVIRLVFPGRSAWGAGRWGAFAWGARRIDGIEALSDEDIRARLRPVLRQWIGARDRVLDITIGLGGNLWGRVRWGLFAWGTPGPSRHIGPSRWGAARWGLFTWGAFL